MTSLQNYVQNNPLPTTGNNIAPTFAQKNITNPISEAFSGGVNEIGSGYNETQQPVSNPFQAMGNLVSGGAHMAEGALGAVFSPLAPVLKPTVGAATNAIADKISNNPGVQNFAMSPAGKVTANIASGISTAANIVGGVAGIQGGMELGGNIWNKAYGSDISGTSALNNASQARVNVAPEAVQGSIDIKNQTGDFKDTLGSNFQKTIQDAHAQNPTRTLGLSYDIVSQLKDVKSTARYAIPTEILDKIPDDLSKLTQGTATSLTMPEAQKLIAQLNKAAYTVNKTTGEVTTNQNYVSLANQIKDAAANSFGDIKDTNGDSVWVKAYQDYSQGRQALTDFSKALNFKKDISTVESNAILNRVLKMSQTPEGKLNIVNAINDLKESTQDLYPGGLDLIDPTKAIQQIIQKDTEVNGAAQTVARRQALMNRIKYVVGIGTLGYIFHRELFNAMNSLSK